MVIKVYTSGICGSQEVRKHQQRVLFILQGLNIDLQIIDVTEPGKDEDLTFMQETAKKHGKEAQLPPQIFNDNDYCGDYADFELANDDDDIMKFLKLESGPLKAEILQSGGTIEDSITQNGIGNHENNTEIPENQETNNTDDIVNAGDDIIANSEDNIDKNSADADEILHESEQKVSESDEKKEKVSSEAEESEEEESE